MTGLGHLSYSMISMASQRGERILRHSIEDGVLGVDETQRVNSILEETVDTGTGEIVAGVRMIVAIDIKPGSYPNSINLKSNGKVPVAILSSPTFDATTRARILKYNHSSNFLFIPTSP